MTFASALLLFLTFVSLPGCRNTTGQVVGAQLDKTEDDSIRASRVLRMPSDSSNEAYRQVAVKLVRTFYKGRQEELFWTSNFPSAAPADSLIALLGNIRYLGLLRDNFHFTEIKALRLDSKSEVNVVRLEALLTDAYLGLWRGIGFGTAAATAETDSLALLSLEEYSLGNATLQRSVTRAEPSFPGYRSLKEGLEQLIDSLPVDVRKAILSDSPLVPEDTKEKIQTIEINLHRWRSERQSFGTRYIFVNIPAFRLFVVEDDSTILESKIIVGTPETPTPELSSTIDCFVTYPYWHVPRKIAVEEYLPLIQKDTSFIRRNNFDILDRRGRVLRPDSVDWNSFHKDHFPVSLRQREGAENALGIIKFIFDNPYAVFLHDTNAKKLFNSKSRAFSHGCIRMERAVELSHYLVTGDPRRKSKYVERFLAEKTRHWVELRQPIPIFLRYYTCDSNHGEINYYEDIYGKDRSISDRLYTGVNSSGE